MPRHRDRAAAVLPSAGVVTELVVADSARQPLARMSVDLKSLQAEAEVAAAGGDPIRLLADTILSSPRLAAFHFDDKARLVLESALLSAAMHASFPEEMVVQAITHSSVSNSADKMKPRADRSDNHRSPFGQRETPLRSGIDHRTTLTPATSDLFEQHVHYPNDTARRTFDSLVGLDEVKARLINETVLLTHPDRLEQWSKKHHGSSSIRALTAFRLGAPFLIFAGDVGTGKTALAECFGDAVARALNEPTSLLRMSIQTRGNGIVGDMSRQVTKAFRAVEQEARRTGNITILLLDEADTLAESRETQQMHHEDRAGVNALIQGVDRLRGSGLPILVVFCSNRLDSIDPAIRRRAVDVVEFNRPSDAQRQEHIERLFGDLRLSAAQVRTLVELTGSSTERAYGFTYSDISDRFARNAVLQAFPDKALTFELLKRVARETVPTRPFGSA